MRWSKKVRKWCAAAMITAAAGAFILINAQDPVFAGNNWIGPTRDNQIQGYGTDEELDEGPQVKVPVDMEVERFDQAQVDQGHSPWRLDPIQTTITFVSLKICPGGIEGPFPIQMEDVKVVEENDETAVVEVTGEKTPIDRVFLRRLVRQDPTGIWTVVGYDPK